MIGVVAGAEGECMGLLDDWNRRSAVSEITVSFVRGFEDECYRVDMHWASSCTMEVRRLLGVHFMVERLSC